MYNRTNDMIFASSGMHVPTEEELRFEAKELVRRNGWGVPLILALKKIHDPYWREALTRILLAKWQQMIAEKDERVFYYDGDGNGVYCWLDAESDMRHIIRLSTAEQVELEQMPLQQTKRPTQCQPPIPKAAKTPIIYNIHIDHNYGSITNIEHSHVFNH